LPLALLFVVLFAGITAPWIAPHDPERGNLKERHIPPFWYTAESSTMTVVERMTIEGRGTKITLSKAQQVDTQAQIGDQVEIVTKAGGSAKFLLGTDNLGRDVLSRIIYGDRISIIVSIVTLGIGGTFGIVVGLTAGWYGG
jgi:ABC-type dipeptide/oligopeptide/nickel transport system permease subunit